MPTATVPAQGAVDAEVRTLAAAIIADLTAIEGGALNGTTIAAGGSLVTGQALRATGAATAGWGPVNLANTSAVTGVLPPENVSTRAGMSYACRNVITANVASLSAFAVASNDGITNIEGDIVWLVKQSTPAQDGPYTVGVVGGGNAPLTRPSWWANAAVIPGGIEFRVNEGTTWGNRVWFASLAGAITVGTSAPAFYPRRVTVTTVAMTAGEVTVSSTWLLSTTNSACIPVVNTGAGTQGILSAPVATRTAGAGSGAVTITSSSNTDTSTVELTILN